MAKNPTPQNDPAALAFSAVEDALKDSVFSLDAPGAAMPEKRPSENGRSERLRAADKIAQQASAVANDDRVATSRLLYSLQSRTSSAPTWLALLLSLAWLVASGAVAWLRFGSEIANIGEFVSSIEFIALLAIMVIPVLGFFAVATLLRRAQDLRNAASSITQAAIRLAEPEVTAADKVASVGQAVRREVNALGDGLERALSRAGELEVMIHNEVTALERTYSDNESRMRALIAELASQRESVLTNTERVREAITESHTGLVFDLDMISQRISGTIVESGGNLTRALETAGNTLTNSFGERTENFVSLVDNRTNEFITALDDSSGRLSLTFEDKTANMARTFETQSDMLSSSIESRMAALTEALDSRASSISSVLETQTITLSTAIEDRTNALSNLLTDGGSTLLEQLRERGEEVSGALDFIGSRISEDVTERSRQAEAILGTMTRQIDESISIQLNAMDSRLQSAVIEINGALDDTSERARLTLSTAGAESLGQFDARLTEIANLLDEKLHILDGVIGDKGENLVERLTEQGASFAARANVLEMALNEESGRFNDIVAERSRELSEVLGAKTKAINESIASRTREISDSLDGHVEIIAEALDTRTGQLDSLLATRTGEVSDIIANRTGELDDALKTRGAAFDESITARALELGQTIDGSRDAFEKSLMSGTQDLANVVNTRTHQLSDALATRTQALSDTLATHTTSIDETISLHTAELASTITQHGNTAREGIDVSLRGVTEIMSARMDELSSMVSSKVAEVNSNLGEGVDNAIARISDAERGVTTSIETASSSVGESARLASELIETGVMSARKAITDMVDQRLGTLPEAITARADITADRLAALNASINTSITQSMADLEAGADRIEETIASRITSASLNIVDSVETTANRMDLSVRGALEQIQLASANLDEIVSLKAVRAADSIEARLTGINRTLEEHTSTFSELVTQKSGELQNALAGHGNLLRDALTENSREAEQLMATSSGRILSDVNAALNRLNDSNLLLQRVLDASTTNLATLETNIAEQTAGYSNTMRDAMAHTEQAGAVVTQHVGALQQTIHAMVNEFSGILGKLDAETANMVQASQSLETYSGTALETLDERRNAMDALAQSFASRADDIDGRMRMFAQSIADTVNDTERRLIAARRAMDDALAATTHSVTDTLNTTTAQVDSTVRRAAEMAAAALTEQSDQVNNALHDNASKVSDILASAAGSVTDVLSSTTGGLADTIADSTQSVRSAIATNSIQLRRALDETTDEVSGRLSEFHQFADREGQRANATLQESQQRMVLDMQRAIEEATQRFSETALAMRDTAREVGSELEATRAELSRGVSELPEETRASAAAMRRVVAEQIEALSELNAIVRAQPASHDVSDRRAAQRPAPRQPEPARAALPDPIRIQPAPEPTRPAEPAPAPVARAETAEGGGWLRDVLRNASAKQAGVDSTGLSGLTDEIARSIDDGALADAWARYQAGESNVFSRRIYSLTGQGTYDEVRKRIQRDADFARTAQAYMNEFEQLLKRAAAGPRAASETRDYLLSDRGKVYTTLAHASGRLN